MNNITTKNNCAYTFSTIGTDGIKYYPQKIEGSLGCLVSSWTTDIEKAVRWSSPEVFDCLMAEYCNTQIEKIQE